VSLISHCCGLSLIFKGHSLKVAQSCIPEAHQSKKAPGVHINTLMQMDNQQLAMEKGDLDYFPDQYMPFTAICSAKNVVRAVM
jgi:hypothetical protein